MPDRLKIVRTSYDTVADTLYLTFSREKPWRYEEDDDGLVWRFSPSGYLVGVTVQAYHRLWRDRKPVLANRIAGSADVDASVVAHRLPV